MGVANVGVAFVVRVCLAVPGRFMIAGFRSSCFAWILRTFVSSIHELEKRFGNSSSLSGDIFSFAECAIDIRSRLVSNGFNDKVDF